MSSVSSTKSEPAPPSAEPAPHGAIPVAAAAFAAGILYLWAEAAFRLAFTYSPGFNADWVLWDGRVGDIAAMWLTISGVAVVAGIALWRLWRGRERVGRISTWTITLIASAIAAPMIGEIGTPAGNLDTGNGSNAAAAVIAYILLGVAVLGSAVLLAVLRARHSPR